MKNALKKHSLEISLILIIGYILINLVCLNTYGEFDYRTFLYNFVYLILILIFIIEENKVEYYGLSSTKNIDKFLYFIPLGVIVSVNLCTGFNINNTYYEIIFYMLNMFVIAFLEEIIFRGFLYRAIEKDDENKAVIIVSLTFGFGHIINLLNGAPVIETLIQIILATAIGFLFVTIFRKGKSLWPCIITHAFFNFFSIFLIDNEISMYVAPIVLFIIPTWYAMYILKKVK